MATVATHGTITRKAAGMSEQETNFIRSLKGWLVVFAAAQAVIVIGGMSASWSMQRAEVLEMKTQLKEITTAVAELQTWVRLSDAEREWRRRHGLQPMLPSDER